MPWAAKLPAAMTPAVEVAKENSAASCGSWSP